MGKLKKNSRSSRHRANPLAVRANRENKQDEQLTKNKILPLIAKLRSLAPNDRSMALGTISIMCDDPKFRKLLLKERLVQIIMEQCLTDSNSEIVVESFGLLRNLVIEEGYDVAIYLWRQNIWKVIQENLNKSTRGFHLFREKPEEFDKVATTLLFDMIENLISLITGLCDSTDEILNTVMTEISALRMFLKEVLVYALDLEKKELKITVSLFNAILDMIYDLSSQSDDFIKSLNSEWDLNISLLESFVDEVTKFNELSKVYIQGVKLQTLDILKDEGLVQIISKIISSIQSIDVEASRNIMIAEVDNTKAEELKDDVKRRAAARTQFQAIEISVEILTAIMEMISYNESFSDELLQLLTSQIPQLLVSLLPHLEFRSRVLTALNNLSWLFITVQNGVEEWSIVAGDVWQQAGTLIPDCDLEEKVSLFGTLWAISMVKDLPLDDSFVQSVIQELEQMLSVEDEMKDEYLVRLIGVLSTLAKKQGVVERNRAISQLLLKLLNEKKVSNRVIVEILDQMFEIYEDCAYDYDAPVFVQMGYLDQLKALKPEVRASLKMIDKNIDRELKMKSEEVYNNLGRFIEYKESELK
jgi:hypothetical protein